MRPDEIKPGAVVVYIGEMTRMRGFYRVEGPCICEVCELRRKDGSWDAHPRYMLRRTDARTIGLRHVKPESMEPLAVRA